MGAGQVVPSTTAQLASMVRGPSNEGVSPLSKVGVRRNMITIAGSKQQGGRRDRLTFACRQSGVGGSRDSHASLAVSGPVLVGQKGQRGTHGTSGANHTDWR